MDRKAAVEGWQAEAAARIAAEESEKRALKAAAKQVWGWGGVGWSGQWLPCGADGSTHVAQQNRKGAGKAVEPVQCLLGC